MANHQNSKDPHAQSGGKEASCAAAPAAAFSLTDVHLTLPGPSGPVYILRGISLDVAPGEAVSVVGPSGSGKTSLLMLLAGMERASRGRVAVAGVAFDALDEDALAEFRRDHIGIVFQAFHLIPTMTALENVSVPLQFAGAKDATSIAAEALEAVGLGHRAGHLPGTLSGGEQQRLALARAVAPRPRLLLADEPTGNLDQETGARIIELMFGLQESIGATLALITHDPALAARCGRTLRMTDGRLHAS